MRTKVARRVLTESESSGISLSPNSVDTQIDSLLVSFEQAAAEVDTDVVPEGTSMLAALRLMTEEEDEGVEQDQQADDVTSDEKKKTSEPAVPHTPKININEFAERVAMLIETYAKRLDIETVIFNRAKTYVEGEHGPEVAKELEDILVTDHGIDLRNVEEDPAPMPTAVGSAPPL
jgi:hypothetical protein